MSEKVDKNVMIKVVLPSLLRDKFKSSCALNSTNMNTVLIEFIEDYVKRTENKKS